MEHEQVQDTFRELVTTNYTNAEYQALRQYIRNFGFKRLLTMGGPPTPENQQQYETNRRFIGVWCGISHEDEIMWDSLIVGVEHQIEN